MNHRGCGPGSPSAARAISERRTIRFSAWFALSGFLAAGLAHACSSAASGAEDPHARIESFLERAAAELEALQTRERRAQWVRSTYITPDTADILRETAAAHLERRVELAREASSYERSASGDQRRRLAMLRPGLRAPPASQAGAAAEVARLIGEMSTLWDTGQGCDGAGNCRTFRELQQTLHRSRDAQELRRAWLEWREVSVPMRPRFARLAQLANAGARELGFQDLGEMWRADYGGSPAALAADVDRIWSEVAPLYEQLHCHVRAGLQDAYGKEAHRADGTIPAHLVGDMWGQQWSGLYDLVAKSLPAGRHELDEQLKNQGYDPVRMTRAAEAFFLSLGFRALPESFWERSLLAQPRDRAVQCSASAATISSPEDVRIKMCVQPTGLDFRTIHHELGHTYYQLAYSKRPYLERDAPNPAFHEAIGELIALSMTPSYLEGIGLLEDASAPQTDVASLLQEALQSIVFMPFALAVDRWRWQVFAGQIRPENYNTAWWQLVAAYQGLSPPEPRGEGHFDAGSKNHVAAQVPYIQYFLARALVFQLHRAACSSPSVPLHRCSIYANREVGTRLWALLSAGAAEPWEDVLERFTGSRRIEGAAMVAYFGPLSTWLVHANLGRNCGWAVRDQTT